MCKGRELVGLPVITQDNGEELGRIQDILYDAKTGALKAVVLDGGSWLREPQVVAFEKLKTQGAKNFSVSGKLAVSNELPEGIRCWQETKGLSLVNSSGTELGLIEDVVIDLSSGRITGLEISTGLVNDLMDGRKEIALTGMVSWGADTVVIS